MPVPASVVQKWLQRLAQEVALVGCVVVDQWCIESDRNAKIEGYTAVWMSQAHQCLFITDIISRNLMSWMVSILLLQNLDISLLLRNHGNGLIFMKLQIKCFWQISNLIHLWLPMLIFGAAVCHFLHLLHLYNDPKTTWWWWWWMSCGLYCYRQCNSCMH